MVQPVLVNTEMHEYEKACKKNFFFKPKKVHLLAVTVTLVKLLLNLSPPIH